MARPDPDLGAAIAVTRFGLGARRGEIAEARRDPQGWLKAQVRREGADQPEGQLGSSRERMIALLDYRREVQQVREAASAAPQPVAMQTAGVAAAAAMPMRDPVREARREARAPLQDAMQQDMLARARLACTTPAGFRERWALFWSNHFTVASSKLQAAALCGPFEREAIRPHVFGRFEDMLVASTTHPGMLVYLDQAQSAGPNSRAGRNRKTGLNENLAREILELHTVGVAAGYTQADVTEFARALTGYSIANDRDREPGVFLFRANIHEPGGREILKRRYDQFDFDQARRVLADLAASPFTARHVARKLAAHFVADEPPPALVDRLAHAYAGSGGDLAVLALALISAPEAWAPAARKFKTPYEFLVSSFRAADLAPSAGPQILPALTTLGQRPFAAPSPKGWADEAGAWTAPDAVVKRLAIAETFGARAAPTGDPQQVARQALGARLAPATLQAIARAETRAQAFAILLMSPEFQRR
jgi:uncharacterized protein (DUF1800 family)